MATSLTLENDSSLAQGYLKVNGSTAATLTTSGITGNLTGNVTGNVTGSLTSGGSITFATAQTASGTSVDFTGIPSWVKRITVMFSGVSTNGSSNILLQIGSGSIQSSGYSSTASTAGGSLVASTAGFIISSATASSDIRSGAVSVMNISFNNWVSNAVMKANTLNTNHSGGDVSISGTLDRIRITTVNGTDTFDAGTINISYEG